MSLGPPARSVEGGVEGGHFRQEIKALLEGDHPPSSARTMALSHCYCCDYWSMHPLHNPLILLRLKR
jgi:hypothetical protein